MVADVLPPLRRDIELMPAASFPSGEPAWTLFDPVTNRFYKIGWTAYQILARWDPSAERLIRRVKEETTLSPTLDTVEEIKDFLIQNDLVQSIGERASFDTVRKAAAKRRSFWGRLFEGILGFRLPLVRPNAFLAATLPFVRPLFSKGFLCFAVFGAFIALYLISTQSALFFSTFLYFFDFSGACAYVAAIVFAKAFHELGHAYAAVLFGCRVPTMGVMLIAGCPMFYTDTTDTWRLSSRKERLIVASAGMAAELLLAVAASFGWLFFSDGFLRSACFLLASSGWVMTLFVNLCPLMRFDGYYILSDLWGIENLRERSARMMRWKIAELLFGYGLPPPERLPLSTRRGLLLYAFCSWLYRLSVFCGIALTLYHFAFKLAGIILFSGAVLALLVLPIVREAVLWKRNWMLTDRKLLRLSVFGGVIVLFAVLFFAPLSRSVSAPAVFRENFIARVYAPSSSQIAAVGVRAGQTVKKGELLARLYSPSLLREYKKNETKITELKWRTERGSFGENAESRAVLQSRLAAALAARDGFRERGAKLYVKAPFDGTVAEIFDGVQTGEWIAENAPMFLLSEPKACRLTAYAREEDVGRLKTGGRVKFYPEPDGKKPLFGTIEAVAPRAMTRLEEAEQAASAHKGGLPVRTDKDGKLVPAGAFFRVSVSLPDCPETIGLQSYRGTAELAAIPESLKTKFVRRLRALWLRESAL